MHFEKYEVVDPQQRLDGSFLRVNLPAAWERSRGKGVLVAVIDSGIAAKHPDLKGAIRDSRDFTSSPGADVDRVGHGTHVAGIIAARDNAVGVVGVAPEAELLNAKVVLDRRTVASPETVAEAIDWCVGRGADVLCLAFEWRKAVPHVREALARAAASGAIAVAAAGNRGPDGGRVGYPAAWPEALAVGYVEMLPDRIRMSVDSAAGPQIAVVAPGSRILSTFPDEIYAYASGTSVAAPFVAGAIALLIAHRRAREKPPLALDEVARALRTTANRRVAMADGVPEAVGLLDPERFVDA